MFYDLEVIKGGPSRSGVSTTLFVCKYTNIERERLDQNLETCVFNLVCIHVCMYIWYRERGPVREEGDDSHTKTMDEQGSFC